MDAGNILTSIGSLIKSTESSSAATFLESVAAAIPANLADPVQQTTFVLSFHAAVAQFVASQATALPALGADLSTGLKTLLTNAAASLRAVKT